MASRTRPTEEAEIPGLEALLIPLLDAMFNRLALLLSILPRGSSVKSWEVAVLLLSFLLMG